ncbi:MAG: Holliday junction resolvase [Candidatus Woesearchaeota archaeon]|nr:MAG: Holliday junction resolvase [Candidatus Woesearchaeota archaeon]
MNHKAKGSNAERELIHLFWQAGWAAVRVAGSGSSKYPSPDVLASNNLRKIALEVKATRDHAKYFTKKEIEELVLFSNTFGAECFVAIKFPKGNWRFVSVEDLKITEKSYMISEEETELKGFLFEEVIEK